MIEYIEFLKEMNQIPANRSLIALVADFISHSEHLRSINDSIHDANLKDERKLQALDMEGFALYVTAHTLDKKALWIKAVSDFADIKKADSHHKACCFASGTFLYEFIREML